jgi:RHS repeat-associated protein
MSFCSSTSFLYDGLNPVQEKAGASVTANILPGLGIDEYFTRTDSTGSRTVLPDALGSAIALTYSSGTLQTLYTYEPFGNTTSAGAASANLLQYTGRENDGTGLYYYRARYYSPKLQRFISEDPILAPSAPLSVGLCSKGNVTPWLLPGMATSDLSQFVNPYAYVTNNPLRLTDPSGLAPCNYLSQAEMCVNNGRPTPAAACIGTQYRDALGGPGGTCPKGKVTKQCLTLDVIAINKLCSNDGEIRLPESCTTQMLNCINNHPNVK